jgi:hypothetical protein
MSRPASSLIAQYVFGGESRYTPALPGVRGTTARFSGTSIKARPPDRGNHDGHHLEITTAAPLRQQQPEGEAQRIAHGQRSVAAPKALLLKALNND